MACNFYNFEDYGKLGIPVKKTIKCGDCPHNMKGFCDWFKMKLVEADKFYTFDLVFFNDIIATQIFKNMDEALEMLRSQYDELLPGFYTIVNKETGETTSMTVLKMDVKDIGLSNEEIEKRVKKVIGNLGLDLDMSMLDIKIEKQKTCSGCEYNTRGNCLKYQKKLFMAKHICYQRGDNDEKC